MSGLNKMLTNYQEALTDLKSNMTVMIGGFGLCGIPEGLINVLATLKISDLTCISNNAGVDDFGIGVLLKNKQIRTMIASYVGENGFLEELFIQKAIDLQLVPQGTLAERIRAGGAGIPAFYTPTGFGTLVAKDKETRQFDNRSYVLETALKADFALIKAWKADTLGNLIYRKTAQNFNPLMATAATITVVEVEEIVEAGELDPDHIHTPGIYVDRLLKGNFEKRIEKRTTRE